jgi:hypothetical protein
MFAMFNWKMDEKVNSAFLVFDLVRGDACFQCERDSGRFVDPNLRNLKKRPGLSAEKSVNRRPGGDTLPNSTGRISDFGLEPRLDSMCRLRAAI